MGTRGWVYIAYRVASFSSDLSDIGAGMMSPFMVVPLHRDCLTVGVSQLDQSSSLNWSKVSGVHEKCFRVLVTAAAGAAGAPALDVPLDLSFCCCCSRSLKLPEEDEKLDRMGVLFSELVSVGKGMRPRLVVGVPDDARIVSWSWLLLPLGLFNRATISEVLLKLPDMASSPTVACRRSSTNVHRPCLKSFAICLTPFGVCVCRGAHVARLLMVVADLGFQSCRGAESIDRRATSRSSSSGNSDAGLAGESSDNVRACPPRMTVLLYSRGAPLLCASRIAFLLSSSEVL